MKRQSQRKEAFVRNNNCSPEEFLEGCGIDPNAPNAGDALAIRRAIARIAEVPDLAICSSHSFSRDLSRLSGWDSLDTIEFVMLLEEELGRPIDRAIATRLPGVDERTRYDPGFLVGDMVRGMLQAFQKEKEGSL